MDDELTKGRPDALERLMRGEEQMGLSWSQDDLRQILAHQLDTPLLYDLGRVGADESSRGNDSSQTLVNSPCRTFRDVIYGASPPLPVLELTKEFAKNADRRADAPLPAPVATFLYFGTISVALSVHGVRITSLGEAEISDGLRWLLGQDWLDDAGHALLSRGLAALGTQCRGAAQTGRGPV
jgi:hypothetical protein